MIYAVLDAQGKCVNRIVWDGSGGWQPPEGCTAVPDDDGLYTIEAPPQSEQQNDPATVLASLTEEQRMALLSLLQPS
jgi:hypothetical protein